MSDDSPAGDFLDAAIIKEKLDGLAEGQTRISGLLEALLSGADAPAGRDVPMTAGMVLACFTSTYDAIVEAKQYK